MSAGEAFDLRGARLNRGLSQRAAAEEIGVKRETLRRLELGVGTVRPANAKRVADFFEVDVMDLPGYATEEAAA